MVQLETADSIDAAAAEGAQRSVEHHPVARNLDPDAEGGPGRPV